MNKNVLILGKCQKTKQTYHDVAVKHLSIVGHDNGGVFHMKYHIDRTIKIVDLCILIVDLDDDHWKDFIYDWCKYCKVLYPQAEIIVCGHGRPTSSKQTSKRVSTMNTFYTDWAKSIPTQKFEIMGIGYENMFEYFEIDITDVHTIIKSLYSIQNLL